MRPIIDDLLAEHPPENIVRLKDLPGVAEIEAIISKPGYHLDKEADGIEDRIDALSRRLFGITEEETSYWDANNYPEGTKVTRALILEQDEWEKHFAFLEDDYEHDSPITTFWAAFGWDVWDDEGWELSIVDWFGRQMVCLLKRIHPRARLSLTGDDPLAGAEGIAAEIAAERWGAKLAEEARRFRPSTRPAKQGGR